MALKVDVDLDVTLDEYASYAHLSPGVRELQSEAATLVPRLGESTVWMVNSTSRGGGVAEMLPPMVALLRQLGVRTEWVVIESDEPDFFPLTKRLHNLIHGKGDPHLGDDDRRLYERVNARNAKRLREWLSPGDIVVVHDPQPFPLVHHLPDDLDIRAVWRCHIGLDDTDERTRAAWSFLAPYADAYDLAVFSAPEYIPDLFPRATVVYPALDPLSSKNKELTVHRVAGILCNAALSTDIGPVVTPGFTDVAHRLHPDGELRPANTSGEIGLITRPIVTQISRWDRLKGFPWVLDAFARVKRRLRTGGDVDPLHRRRLEIVRLVLAGPDVGAVEDDPESREVFDDLAERYRSLDPEIQRDVAVLTLPMSSRTENALMVNALQRTSSVIVQNSLREGFGLTIVEGMWKHVPVLSNRRACGPRQQVRDGLDGRMVRDPTDSEELAHVLNEMLESFKDRELWGRRGQRRAYDEFLIFAQLQKWLRLLTGPL